MTVAVSSTHASATEFARDLYALTKPRVTLLAVFCAIIGMFLAAEGMVPWTILLAGSVGIGRFRAELPDRAPYRSREDRRARAWLCLDRNNSPGLAGCPAAAPAR